MVDFEVDDCRAEHITSTDGFGDHETRQETVSFHGRGSGAS